MMATARFSIRTCAEPQALARLINLFAQLGLVPSRVSAQATGGIMLVSIEQPDLDDHRAAVIAEKMRGSVLVETVELRRGKQLLTPLSEQRP